MSKIISPSSTSLLSYLCFVLCLLSSMIRVGEWLEGLGWTQTVIFPSLLMKIIYYLTLKWPNFALRIPNPWKAASYMYMISLNGISFIYFSLISILSKYIEQECTVLHSYEVDVSIKKRTLSRSYVACFWIFILCSLSKSGPLCWNLLLIFSEFLLIDTRQSRILVYLRNYSSDEKWRLYSSRYSWVIVL